MSDIFDLFKKIEAQKSAPSPITFIIAGLGNPGSEYEKTRHNAGFMAIDYIAKELSVSIKTAKFSSLCAEASIGGARVLLMKPQTYMNSSGTAIAEAAKFYKISPASIIVLHDEISFEPGRIRIRRKGSAGGHNGLKSIIASLGSDEFPRIKIGVGQKPTPEYDLVNWVLGRFPEADIQALSNRYGDIFDAIRMMISGETEKAMSKYSG